MSLCAAQPGSLDVLRPVHVAQLAQAEPIPSRRIHVTVHRHDGTRGLDLERLADLDVHLKIGDGAPVLRSCGRRTGGDTCEWSSLLNTENACFLVPILTGVVGDGGLEGNFIGNRPCNNTTFNILTFLYSHHYTVYLIKLVQFDLQPYLNKSADAGSLLDIFKCCKIELFSSRVNKSLCFSQTGGLL